VPRNRRIKSRLSSRSIRAAFLLGAAHLGSTLPGDFCACKNGSQEGDLGGKFLQEQKRSRVKIFDLLQKPYSPLAGESKHEVLWRGGV
jgi:hypothetical protein